MAKHIVKILDTAFVTQNVKRIQVEKPQGYTFTPGEATDLALNMTGWKTKARAFNFTSLTSAKTLEFIIKIYDEHDGVTHQLGLAHKGDELILGEPYGALTYHGPGFFFAGGARKLGEGFFKYGDRAVIDGALVNGSANGVGLLAGVMRHLQTGYIYHYAFVMVAGVLTFLTWLLLR